MTPGEMLGPYRVLDKLGEGGMGEVYRARDTRLDRTVALKVLPRALASDPQFRERFDREARVVSQLHHPHICVLHDVGRDSDTDYLVLELIDGESLAERIAKGPLPLGDALAIGSQICEALDAAHRHGIVHRDLKPGNVMLARPGASRQAPVQAKLLDFGLAKTALGGFHSNPAAAAQTITAALTAQGTMLGTFQYMAPEQGAEADARSDIWAFGCVLYEMVSGARAFTGKSPASLAGKILTAEPASLTEVKPDLPPALDRIVRKSLAKDPDARWQSARDLGDELKRIRDARGAIASAAPARRPRPRERAAWGLALTLAIGAAAWLALRPEEPRPPVRLSMPISVDTPLLTGWPEQLIAISRDGQRIAYVASVGTRRQLFLRALAQFEPTPIRGTENGTSAAFSPDGESVAFIADGKLKKVQLNGTSATVSLPEMTASRGLAWSDDGFIYLPLGLETGISRISAVGGTVAAVTALDAGARSHRWPHVLPGGRTLLYVSQRHGAIRFDETDIVARRLDSGDERTIVRGGTDPRFVAPRHVVFGRGDVLMAVPFDERRLETIGEPVPVVEGVAIHSGTGAGQYAVASNGTLVYAPGSAITATVLTWVDRDGRETPAAPEERTFNNIRLSPDGSRVAYVDRSAGNADIWVFPLTRGSPTRLTFGREFEDAPVWSPDGMHIYYSSNKEGYAGIYRKRADGTGAEEKVYGPPQRNVVTRDISPDGRWLVFAEDTRLAVMSLTAEPAPRSLNTGTVPLGGSARISPDGKWLAYQQLDGDLYVRPFPDGEGHWQVTTGGSFPVWSHDGREIYFREGRRLLAASVTMTGSAFTVEGIRAVVPDQRYAPSYDAAPDGRLLMLKDQTTATGSALNVILNWTRELRR